VEGKPPQSGSVSRGSVRAEGRKPKALLIEVRSGFIEQKRELQEAVREQPKPLAYDTPADVVRNVFPW
jgi:hypothetical protein